MRVCRISFVIVDFGKSKSQKRGENGRCIHIDLEVSLGWGKSVCESIIVVQVQILHEPMISSNGAFFRQIFFFLRVSLEEVHFDIKM